MKVPAGFLKGNKLGWMLASGAVLYVLGVLALRLPIGNFASRSGAAPPAYEYEPSTGAGEVKIIQFYSTAAEVPRGESALICYSVQRARAVRLDPPVDEIWPAVSHCISVTPAESTTYTLWATGMDGREVSRSFRVLVGPAQPRFVLFATSGKQIRRGEYLAICYGVKNAASVRLEPMSMVLPPVEKQCVQFRPQVTQDYTLTATSADGVTAKQQFSVKVR